MYMHHVVRHEVETVEDTVSCSLTVGLLQYGCPTTVANLGERR